MVDGTSGAPPREGVSASSVACLSGRRLVDADAIRRLAEIAFIGIFIGKVESAEAIFHQLRLLCPGNPYVEIGLAFAWTMCGKATDAASLLERLPVTTTDQRGFVALCSAMALQECGYRSAAERKFKEAIAHGGLAAEFARLLTAGRSA
jgi:predicted Zn-dependent protease